MSKLVKSELDNPMISVVMSVYNAEEYLEEAIESVLVQRYSNFEFIIINDGSSDNSLEIIQNYMQRDERIILIDQKNRGLSHSLNEGISIAKGKYIARMDADDISLSTRFEEQVEFMQKNPAVGICGSWVEMFSKNSKSDKWRPSNSNKQLKVELLFSSCFAHPSVMIRKSVLNDNDLKYNPEYLNSQDYELWSKISKVTQMSNIQRVLLKYRVTDRSITATTDTKQIGLRYELLKNIIKSNIESLQIKNTEEENKLHFNLSTNKRLRDNNLSFEELEQYFDKLVRANNATKIFDALELKKILGRKWLRNFIYKKEIKAIFSNYFYYGIWSVLSR